MLASRLKGWSALLKSSWRHFEPEILPRVCLTDAGQVHLNEFHHQTHELHQLRCHCTLFPELHQTQMAYLTISAV